MKLNFHDLANLFPTMKPYEVDDLAADIKGHGLREKIVLLDGKILDGRNRYLACQKAGIEPETQQFQGVDPLSFVVSKNLRRRHLKDSQRALIAARIANMPQGCRRADRTGLVSQKEAADMLNVAERTVRMARVVETQSVQEVRRLVESGAVSILAAAKVASLPAATQRDLASKGSSALVAAARKARRAPGRQGRNEYSILWRKVDEICDALEGRRLDKVTIAAQGIVRECARIANSRRPEKPTVAASPRSEGRSRTARSAAA
jgi:hypothetical protein